MNARVQFLNSICDPFLRRSENLNPITGFSYSDSFNSPSDTIVEGFVNLAIDSMCPITESAILKFKSCVSCSGGHVRKYSNSKNILV